MSYHPFEPPFAFQGTGIYDRRGDLMVRLEAYQRLRMDMNSLQADAEQTRIGAHIAELMNADAATTTTTPPPQQSPQSE